MAAISLKTIPNHRDYMDGTGQKDYRKHGALQFSVGENMQRKLVFFGAAVIAIGLFAAIGILMFFGSANLSFRDCVAVVNIDGEISSEGTPATLFSSGSPGGEEIASAISALDGRDEVKAVVVRINSPGGSVIPSRQIYEAVKNLNKTSVAYLYETAASGGYYVALGSDYIVTEPETITGSIGVISLTMDITGLMEKVGVNISAIKSAEHKDFLSEYKTADAEETAIMQGIIDEIYQDFVNVLKQSRGNRIRSADLANLTDGRIVSGKQAVNYGLADMVGSKDDAIRKAADLANMTYDKKPDVCEVSYSSSQSGGLFSEIERSIATIFIGNYQKTGIYLK
jgi:protease-4